jgi:hypothetical protein
MMRPIVRKAPSSASLRPPQPRSDKKILAPGSDANHDGKAAGSRERSLQEARGNAVALESLMRIITDKGNFLRSDRNDTGRRSVIRLAD